MLSIANRSDDVEAHTEWSQPSSQTRAAWANEIDTTEAGAYACAIAAVELTQNLYAIGRAETGTGADYYLAPKSGNRDDFENAIRLEISGTDKGNENLIEKRLRQKAKQTVEGNSNLPAIAAVVGFRALRIKLKQIDSE